MMRALRANDKADSSYTLVVQVPMMKESEFVLLNQKARSYRGARSKREWTRDSRLFEAKECDNAKISKKERLG